MKQLKKLSILAIFLILGIYGCKQEPGIHQINTLKEAIEALNGNNVIKIQQEGNQLVFEVSEKSLDSQWIAHKEQHNCVSKDKAEFYDCVGTLLDAGYCVKIYKDGDTYYGDIVDC